MDRINLELVQDSDWMAKTIKGILKSQSSTPFSQQGLKPKPGIVSLKLIQPPQLKMDD